MKCTGVFIIVVLFCKLAQTDGTPFEAGQEFSFTYASVTSLEEAETIGELGPVQYRIRGNVKLNCVWKQNKDVLLNLQVELPKLAVKSEQFGEEDGFAGPLHSNIDALSSKPVIAHISNGKLVAVYFSESESLDSKNLKKGLASIFQYRTSAGEREEEDVSGKCKVVYETSDGQKIRKVKTDCEGFPIVQHNNKVLEGQLESQISSLYEISKDSGIPHTYTSEETHVFHTLVYQKVSTKVQSTQHLTLKDSSTNGMTVKGNTVVDALSAVGDKYGTKLEKESLMLQEHAVCTLEKCKHLKQLVSSKRDSLAKVVTKEGVSAFLAVQKSMEATSKDDIVATLKSKENKNILPTLVDVAGACSTRTCHQAVMDVIPFPSDIDLAEQYLLALTVASKPTEFHINDLLGKLEAGIEDTKLRETVVLSVASLANSFCKTEGNCLKQVVQDVRTYLTSSLSECTDSKCRSMYIRSLRNLADSSTVPLLLQHAEGSDKAAAVMALRALYTMLPEHMNKNVKESLVRIFHQMKNKADVSARCMAAELLLMAEPDADTLATLLYYLPQRNEKELNAYVLQRIQDLSESNAALKPMLKEYLTEVSKGNYHTVAQGGLSSAFSRGFYYHDDNGNSTFTSQLIISGGLLKRSTIDLDFTNDKSTLRMLSLVLYADGLGSLMGSEEDSDPEAETTAGMDLTLLNSQMRPFVFFTGQGELMSHVWSGTASDLTTALKGTISLHDSSVAVPLQSGFLLNLSLRSALAFHLEGKVELSLWYKNAKSLVKISSALKVENHASVDSSYIVGSVNYDMNTEASLDFFTDVDFSDEVLMCLQMKQPPFKIRHKVNKRERIPDTKQIVRKTAKTKETVAGRTYKLNDKNTELCNAMFK